MHMAKLATAMKAAHAAQWFSFHLGLTRLPETFHTDRTHVELCASWNSFRSICASLLFSGCFDKMQKSSASLQEVLQVVQICSSTRECLRHQVGVDPLNDDVVIEFLSRDMLKKIKAKNDQSDKVRGTIDVSELVSLLF